ncbi:MAG: alkylmercury lyase [Hamadaea sp.]|nr:alkylmercury lyase [Hamadaea sp.]
MTTPDTPQPLLVQLRSVPDCPNLPATRQRLLDILAETTTPWTLTELEGDYPSPSILVNGVDVTGATPDSPAACVLHPPTADQIRAALADATP